MSATKTRTVAGRGKAVARPGNYEFSVVNVSAASVGFDLDPVIGFDHFHIRAPKFPPHPHAGFSAVTYLFEDSEGDIVSRDSAGHAHVARPGGVVWSVTGRGVIHEEFPRVRGLLSHGLQLFVNLASAAKREAPRVLFLDGPDVPVVHAEGVRVRVVAGTVRGMPGGIEAPAGFTLLDVHLAPGASFEHAVPSEHSALAYVVTGGLTTASGPAIGGLEVAAFAADGDTVALRAEKLGAHVVLLAGRPLRERVVSYGPFTMNSEEEIQATMERYRTGGMGQLTPTAHTR
jgi:redox-sensitive bicupin YhaK (pirin superfamily)